VLAADDCMTQMSPQMYADVFFPAIEKFHEETNPDRTLLHFHNAAGAYADVLAERGLFDAVQWGIDPNHPVLEDLDRLKRLQAAGVRLFIGVLDVEEAETLLEELAPKGLLLLVDAPDLESARGLLERGKVRA
jgi:hypothetical protein